MCAIMPRPLPVELALGILWDTFRRRHGVLTDPDGSAGGTHQRPTPEDKTMTSDEDFTRLDDPAFLAERRRVRELLEHTPAHELSAGLADRYQRLNEEFLRRARLAWTASATGSGLATMSKAPALVALHSHAARLLATEVLLADPEALGDDVLESCLYMLRDKLTGAGAETG
jgi:hypothetical protein